MERLILPTALACLAFALGTIVGARPTARPFLQVSSGYAYARCACGREQSGGAPAPDGASVGETIRHNAGFLSFLERARAQANGGR